MKLEGHRFLITGGSGFVGIHVAARLLAQGAERVVLYDKAARRDQVATLPSGSKVDVIEADILDERQLERALSGIHGVFHMAVLPLGPCEKDPRLAVEVNIRGAYNVIGAAVKAGVGKLVYTSASSVYGDTREIMDESHALNAWSMYGVSKLCAEFLLRPSHAVLPYAIVRYMNVYGPGQAGGLIPTVLGRIRAGQAPVISGDGSASFDFVHVRDAAACTVLAMQSDVTKEAFNVGSGTEVTVKEIVTLLLQLTGSTLTPVYQPAAAGAMTRRVGSCEKAKQMLGFRPSIPFREGLAELVKDTHG